MEARNEAPRSDTMWGMRTKRKSARYGKASAAQKRAAQEAEDAETVLKRAKPSICKAAQEFVCPFSLDLPVEPVMAGDVSYTKMHPDPVRADFCTAAHGSEHISIFLLTNNIFPLIPR